MNERALSTTVGYVIGLGIMMLLMTTLLIAGGNFVGDQREQAIRSQLEVVGQQVSNDLSRADRAVEAVDASNVDEISLRERMPQRIAGNPYRVDLVTSTANPHFILTTDQPDVRVRVNATARSTLAESTFDGGIYRIWYNTTAGELVIEDV